MKIARNGEWLSAMIGTESAMMCVENGNYVVLSRVGARIWELIEEPKTLQEICRRLVEEFDVSEDVCRAEVDAFIVALQEARASKCLPTD